MGTVALSLTVPPEVYEALREEATRAKKSPEDLSVEVLLAFLASQRKLAEGRSVLRTMPRRAAKRGRHSYRTDAARRHDDHLYGDEV